VQRSPTECGVSECDREASIVGRSSPSRDCCAMKKKRFTLVSFDGDREKIEVCSAKQDCIINY
jgi:hypothetical protein